MFEIRVVILTAAAAAAPSSRVRPVFRAKNGFDVAPVVCTVVIVGDRSVVVGGS